jgi:hypothetical protein
MAQDEHVRFFLGWTAVSGLKHLWLDASYEGRCKRWAEDVLSLSVEIVRKNPESPSRRWWQ